MQESNVPDTVVDWRSLLRERASKADTFLTRRVRSTPHPRKLPVTSGMYRVGGSALKLRPAR
jgi:hypothetical protein